MDPPPHLFPRSGVLHPLKNTPTAGVSMEGMSDMESDTSRWSSSESDSSGWSSTTSMSVSRIPISQQLRELYDILQQGLDGASNLLHTLNSTTYICFVDRDGLLTDPSRTVQEICLCSQSDAIPTPSASIPSMVSRGPLPEGTPPPPEGEEGGGPCGGGRQRSVHSCPSSVEGGQVSLEVIDMHRDRNIPLGIRFEDPTRARTNAMCLSPLVLSMALSQIPTHLPSATCAGWIFSQSIKNVAMADWREENGFRECLCPPAKLCGISDRVIKSFAPVRFILIIGSDGKGEYVMLMWLLKDPRDGTVHLFCKANPQRLIPRCVSMYNGQGLSPMTELLNRHLDDLLIQWKSSGMESYGFSYRPLNRFEQAFLLHALDEHSIIRETYEGSECRWSFVECFPGLRTALALSPIIQHETPVTSGIQRSPSLHSKAPAYHSAQFGRRRHTSSWGVVGGDDRAKYGMTESDDDGPRRKGRTSLDEMAAKRTAGGRDKSRRGRKGLLRNRDWLPASPAQIHVTADGRVTPPIEHANDEKGKPDKKSVEKFLRRLQSKQIFMGMCATKTLAPTEIAGRIEDFHDAGIRFVYFSRSDITTTRIVGSQLGLETGWNSVVSLADPVDDSVPKNSDGKVVLPSGVEAIRHHISNVDNVPLLVSLFSDCDTDAIRQMIAVFQENGEAVTCIGSATRASNFELFDQANCGVSFLIPPQTSCCTCMGKREPSLSGVSDLIHPSLNIDRFLAASITSLPCALQHVPNTSECIQCNQSAAGNMMNTAESNLDSRETPVFAMELLLHALKESRRIVDSITQATVFYMCCCVVLSLILVCQALLFTHPILSGLQIISLLFVYFPILSVFQIANPATSEIMRELPLKPASNFQYTKKNANSLFLRFAVRFVPTGFVVIAMSQIHLYHTFKSLYNELQDFGLTSMALSDACAFKPPPSVLFGGWLRCINDLSPVYDTLGTPLTTWSLILPIQCVSMLSILTFIILSSFAFVGRYESMIFDVPPWRNIPLMWASVSILVVNIGVSILQILAIAASIPSLLTSGVSYSPPQSHTGSSGGYGWASSS
eukprot:GHVO01034604.1.p1 GENE.GHVO01034604.1~~GHVO01034604.1.p1  ORF type:complete len:1062 (+),score=209.82 GHVO01034604.1:319-3504(+)